MKNYFIIVLILLVHTSCTKNDNQYTYQSDTLKVEQVSPNCFVHTSYLKTNNFGNIPCNGMIIIKDGESIIYDTPTNDATSKELITWIRKEFECKIKAIVVTHFHVDCLGGLDVFHDLKIPSYANNKTIELAKAKGFTIPENGFDEKFELEIADKKVICAYFGAGHTFDNIVGYFPDNNVLFGGCLIKGMNAGKGNLADADTTQWSNTVRKLSAEYPGLEVVIPGHGKYGDADLLDFTIKLFDQSKN